MYIEFGVPSSTIIMLPRRNAGLEFCSKLSNPNEASDRAVFVIYLQGDDDIRTN